MQTETSSTTSAGVKRPSILSRWAPFEEELVVKKLVPEGFTKEIDPQLLDQVRLCYIDLRRGPKYKDRPLEEIVLNAWYEVSQVSTMRAIEFIKEIRTSAVDMQRTMFQYVSEISQGHFPSVFPSLRDPQSQIYKLGQKLLTQQWMHREYERISREADVVAAVCSAWNEHFRSKGPRYTPAQLAAVAAARESLAKHE